MEGIVSVLKGQGGGHPGSGEPGPVRYQPFPLPVFPAAQESLAVLSCHRGGELSVKKKVNGRGSQFGPCKKQK